MAVYRRRIAGLNDEQVMHAMGIDDAYHVERVLAEGRGCTTERVTIEGAGPFIRKKIPSVRANRAVWAALASSACARLPQVVATYEMPDCFVAVYDDIPGETLLSVVERAGSLSARDALQLAGDLCEAVSCLHSCGVMHLDISPANVIVAADGAHLIDFGNARMIAPGLDAPRSQGRPQGTWGFAAPEQFFSKPEPRSDIYALGRVLGYMLTGILPDEDNLESFEKALTDDSVVPSRLGEIIDRASGFGPNERYRTADELARELRACSDCSEDQKRDACGASSPKAAGARSNAPDAAGAFSSRDRRRRRVAASRTRRAPFVIAGSVVAVLAVLLAVGFACLRVVSPEWGLAGGDAQGKADGGQQSGLVDGPSGDDGSVDGSLASTEDIEKAHEALEIVEGGWGVADSGYVMYALALKNSSDALTVEFPEIVITGRDEAGSVVFSDSQILNVIYPGQELVYASQAGNGTPPATVEFSVARPQDYQVLSRVGEAPEFFVTPVREGRDSMGDSSFTGEVTLVKSGSDGEVPQQIWLSLVLRDGAGKIVYGGQNFITCPAEGETVPFEVRVYDCPSYSTAEVVAMAW